VLAAVEEAADIGRAEDLRAVQQPSRDPGAAVVRDRGLVDVAVAATGTA
jgi:hypothetical protein